MSQLSLCVNGNLNVGGPACDVSRGVLKIPYISSGEFAIDTDCINADTFTAAMISRSKLSKSNSNKIFPLPEVQDITRKSEANKTGTLNQGFTLTLLEGRAGYEIKGFAGSIQAKALRKFNNKTVRIFELDSNNNVWGVKSGNIFKGFQAKIFVSGDEMATAQNVEEGVVTITVSFLSNVEYKDSNVYMPVNADQVEQIAGLVDCKIKQISHTAGSEVYTLRAYVATTQAGQEINVSEQFGSTLAAAANFTAKSGTTLNSAFTTNLAITSVSYSAPNMVVTFNSVTYAALTDGTYIKLIPDAPNDLDTAGVNGIEIDPVYLVVEQ